MMMVVTSYLGMTRSPELAVMREPVVFSRRCSTPTNCQEMWEPWMKRNNQTIFHLTFLVVYRP